MAEIHADGGDELSPGRNKTGKFGSPANTFSVTNPKGGNNLDLTTTYLGLELRSPFLPGASPLSQSVEKAKRLEDAGAPAITLHSLFEEQIINEQISMHRQMDEPAESFGEATTYFPNLPDFQVGPEAYLDHIRRVKEAVGIPVIASLTARHREGGSSTPRR